MLATSRALPVFRIFAPAAETWRSAVGAAANAPFSYAPVGGTGGPLPAGFDHDVQRLVVGRGEASWRRAVAALRRWKQFDQPWIRFHDPDLAIAPGAVVAFSSWQYGVWALNLCRIVDVFDVPEGPVARFGFAHGTLEGHTVAGEERFELAWDRVTDEVSFEIRKFSRLRHWMVRAFGPLARSLQKRFSREALESVRREVAGL